MGTIVTKLPYLESFRDRHGKRRFYVRIKGKRTPIYAKPGTVEFAAAYTEAVQVAPIHKVGRGRAVDGSVADLLGRYYASAEFRRLRSSTQDNYRSILDAFGRDHGHRAVALLRREHIKLLVGALSEKPGAAVELHRKLRLLLEFARDLGWIEHNPATKLKTPRLGEVHTWTEEEIATFEARWPIGSKQRLAFALHLYTGQRRADVCRMTWADYDGESICLKQRKTGKRLVISVHPALQAILDSQRRDAIVILKTAYGAAFSVVGYGLWMSKAIHTCLPARCVLHGLRKAAARRLAEAGCSTHEIAAITGHASLGEVERYTRAADQRRLGASAVSKLKG